MSEPSRMALIIIPARRGSQTVRGKNVQLVDGQPLFLHAARTGRQAGRVVVSTNDPTVASIADIHGFEVHDRTKHVDGEATMLSVIRHVCEDLDHVGPGLLIQPTVPFVTASTLQVMLNTAIAVDGTVVGGRRAQHLVWSNGVRPERVNRQQISSLEEVGVYAWANLDALREPDVILQLPDGETLDIDTVADLHAARLHAGRKRILFLFLAGSLVGSGHAHRVAALADALQHHDCYYQTDGPDWAHQLMAEHGVRPFADGEPHLVVNDTLGYSTGRGSVATVNVEDSGKHQLPVDATVNALYGTGPYSGADWAVLRPEFHGLPDYPTRDTRRVLLLFGGTDPGGFTQRVGRLFPDHRTASDYGSVAEAMFDCDLLVTSAGRTVFEAAAVGIPAVVIAQNTREASHTHLGSAHGNVFLGLGQLTSDDKISSVVHMLLDNPVLREEMSRIGRSSVDGRGVHRFVGLVDGLLAGNTRHVYPHVV